MNPCGISHSFPWLSPVPGQVPTCYAPVRHFQGYKYPLTFDLHVLSTPPAFILSQDQTLRKFTEFTCNTEDSSPILPVSCSISSNLSQFLYSRTSTLDRLKFLTVFWRCPQNHPSGHSLSQTTQPIAPYTTAGFLSYHSSVVNVPLHLLLSYPSTPRAQVLTLPPPLSSVKSARLCFSQPSQNPAKPSRAQSLTLSHTVSSRKSHNR